MGGGVYSSIERLSSSRYKTFSSASRGEIFTQRQINNAMNPYGIKIRESRDSEEHPNSLAIVIGLDETGSMGSISHYLVKDGLPNLMDGIIGKGVKDPQVLFLGIGDHECDEAPLQVGQFESSDELLDKWLTTVYLEGGGGSNYGESYLLAWYFAAYHTAIDCFEKRNQKGVIFTIGDEPVLKEIPEDMIRKIMGEGQYRTFSAYELLDEARKKYIVKHLHMKEGQSGRRQEVIDSWKQIMGEDLVLVDRKEEISNIIPEIAVREYSKNMNSFELKKEEIFL